MNLQIEDIPRSARKWEVKQAFANVLHHHPDFRPPSAENARLMNFEVTLEPSYNSLPSNGRGTLTLPEAFIGNKFYSWATRRENDVRVHGRKLWLGRSEERLKRGLVEALRRTPYVDPREQAEREDKLEQIRQIRILLDAIQFGTYYHRPEDPATANRYFSNEFEIRREDTISGELLFDYNRKLFRVEMGDCVTEDTVEHIVIDLNNVKKSAYGSTPNGQCYVCFEFWQPPRFERQARLRAYSADRRKDARDFRERLPHLGGEHEAITPFAYQIRLVLSDSRARRDVRRLCEEAGIRLPSKVQIDVDVKGFFSPEKLKTTRQWILSYDWPVRFQLEALLRTGLTHTDDILSICDSISTLVRIDGVEVCADFLRRFSEKIRSKGNGETVAECFKTALREERNFKEAFTDADDSTRTKGSVKCAHAIVTPTRILLEGPYDTQSNRVIRRYYEYRDNFIRVEFREENRMSFRWPLEVSGRSLIEQRFGKILKQGFEIAGRTFRFLGYSTSGLRDHTTWFMADFEHPEEGLVTPDKIRSGLGDFRSCINHPSKYAARIAQAFSGTDPSYKIRAGQWTEGVEDLGNSPYEFTDGQGSISIELRDRIWDVLCEAWPDKRKLVLKPSAFQIRFLGCKGIVVVDEQLEGVQMRLRNSMKKFAVDNATEAEIEIAKAFIKPGPARLCRPLIAVLEDLGVDQEVFKKLQDLAKETVVTAADTIKKTIELLRNHDLGNVYGLRWVLQHLADAGMGMEKELPPEAMQIMDNKFIQRLIGFAQTHILSAIKHDARIAIPDAYQLVGCADEGPAYIASGDDPDDVLCLKEGEIFACVQQPEKGSEPIYIDGLVSISRSPHIHPGDVQRVKAIGKPPEDGKKCFFRNLKNVVVMPSVGKRSLASMLAGGDVDGDEFLVIKYSELLPPGREDPASYEGVKPRLLERESTIDDICDFFVEYMQSDVVGLVADQHLTIADQSKDGTFDRDCIALAGLCSQAVDYPKNGVPVNIENLPHTLIRAKPDWKKPEDNDYRPADYYESNRALGVLFRQIEVPSISDLPSSYPNGMPPDPVHEPPLSDNISKALRPAIQRHLGRFHNSVVGLATIEPLFRHYARELGYVCLTHAPSENTDMRLSEEEVALGAILAKCSQRRWKKDRTHRMREHAAQLVHYVRHQRRALGAPLDRDKDKAIGKGKGKGKDKDGTGPPEEELRAALERAWAAWDFGMRNRTTFGAQSFALIGLGVVCDMLEKLEKKPEESESPTPLGQW